MISFFFNKMQDSDKNKLRLPTPDQLHCAIDIYLGHAYLGDFPETISGYLPDEGEFDVAAWIMGEMVERDPASAPLEIVRSAAFRLGNTFYPNMKFRISRPPNDTMFIFSVDCHDAILSAKKDSPDFAMLEELKAHNAKLAETILIDWEKAGLPTERNYLRFKIQQAKERKESLGGDVPDKIR